MKRNMRIWLDEYIKAEKKKAMPVLSFPGIHLIDETVEELVKDGKKQADCMEAIAQKFDMGVSLSLMDLSVEAEAFGCQVTYSRGEVPTVHGALLSAYEEAEALQVPAVHAGRPEQCILGIKEAAARITDRPVLAGIIGPFSLAGRLLDMTEIMILCYEEPEIVELVLEKAAEFLVEYAKAFKEAGADGLVMAEPAAGLLSPALMDEFSTPYVRKIMQAVEDDTFVVMYHNCGNVVPLLKNVKAVGARAYSFGNAIDIEEALKYLPSDVMVIGNIDPAGVIRGKGPKEVYENTLALLKRCGKYPNFIISSGCDIPPETSIGNIQAFFNAVDDYYAG